MQRRIDHVSGQGGVKGHFGGLEVAYFAEQDDVRVLPQQGAQHAREGQADLFADQHLAGHVEVILDRVFDRDVILVRRRIVLEQRVQRRGLATAGRSGGEDDALRPGDHVADAAQVVGGETEAVE